MPHYILNFLLIATLVFNCLSAEAIKNQTNKKFTVVIDPGHGGKDVGATDNGLMEKNINLKVAKELENLIKKRMKDTKVVMTRDDDSYLTLQQRADKANKAQGDIFISIHTNSVDLKNKNRKNIAGSSVYTLGLHKDENNLQVAMRENAVIELESNYEQKYSGFDPQRDESYIIFEMAQKKNLSQSIKLAESIERQLENAGRQNRGVHQAGFWVLWSTSMPAVLVELDFICNPESAAYMSSDKGAKELAQAIFNAVENYNSQSVGNLANVSTQETNTRIEEDNDDDNDAIVVSGRKKRTTIRPATTQSATPTQNYAINNSKKRKRRSLSAKAKSENKSYEYNIVNLSKNASGVKADSGSGLMADVSNLDSDKDNTKSKNSKQKKEKQPKQDKKKEKAAKNISHNARLNKLVTVYKIQLLSSQDLISQKSSRFCGLSPITTYKENNQYKYYYGESTDLEELESVLADVKKKIPDAFIVSSTKSVQAK